MTTQERPSRSTARARAASAPAGDEARIRLTPEEAVLLLTCRPYPSAQDDADLRRLAGGAVDWAWVLWRAEFLRTLPLLRFHLLRTDTLAAVPDHLVAYLDAWAELSAARSQLLQMELDAITRELASSGLDFYLLKGCALAPLYPDPASRAMLDIDVMIRQDDALAVRGLMTGLGYAHGLWDPDTNGFSPVRVSDILEYQEDHYELPAFTKLLQVPVGVPASLVPTSWRWRHLKCFVDDARIATFPVFVDFHVNLSLDFDLDDVWWHPESIELFGRRIAVQSATDTLWFLAARLYHETYQMNTPKLSMLGDAATVLDRAGDRIDWPRLVTVTHKYGMQPGVFYVLGQLRKLFGCRVPDEVLDELSPDRSSIPSSHDWGDLLPKLFPRSVLFDVALP